MTGVTLHHGDCLDILAELPDASVDAVVTDPPYGLEFMGREWDGADGFRRSLNPADVERDSPFGRTSRTSPEYRAGTLFQEWCEAWSRECLRVLKPGGHLLAFGGTRTWHRLACAVEDAGFEIRDSLFWHYGSGFPKSHNVGKALEGKRCGCAVPYIHASVSPEGLPDVRRGVDAEDPLPSSPESDMLEGVRGKAAQSGHEGPTRSQRPADNGDVRGVLDTREDPAGVGEAQRDDLLLPDVQRRSAGPRVGNPRTQGARGVDAGERGVLQTQDDGRTQPRMEGRGDVLPPEGQLRRPEVRAVPGGVPTDGPQGRLHHGAPAGHGPMDRPNADPDGMREPQEPRPAGQSQGEPGALPDQRGPQAWGGWPVCGRCSQPVIPDGLGTALKPATEPIVVARKPLVGTVAANVLAHGTGALNIDGCRVDHGGNIANAKGGGQGSGHEAHNKPTRIYGENLGGIVAEPHAAGRWPANVVLDESQAAALDEQSGELTSGWRDTDKAKNDAGVTIGKFSEEYTGQHYSDTGGASRFFYVAREDEACTRSAADADTEWTSTKTEERAGAEVPTVDAISPRFMYAAKADASERVRVNGTAHPTVKPLALMRWLVRLVTPPGGTVLEPFAGSGTTVEACILEGLKCIAVEREADYLPLIRQRINRRRDPVEAVKGSGEDGGLFDLLDGGAA